MTFLEGVQKLRLLCSISGAGPSAVTGQAGESERLITWYGMANDEIADRWTDWKFLRSTGNSMDTVAAQATLAVGDTGFPTDLADWDIDSFKLDGNSIEVIDYSQYEYDAVTTQATPSRVIVNPDNSLLFDPVPDSALALTFDYRKTPTVLAADTDTPDIPDQYQMAIIGRAMMYYADFENAPEFKTTGAEIYAENLSRLELSQLPFHSQMGRKSEGADITVIVE